MFAWIFLHIQGGRIRIFLSSQDFGSNICIIYCSMYNLYSQQSTITSTSPKLYFSHPVQTPSQLDHRHRHLSRSQFDL
jgi:hypothetical protein